MSSFFTKIFCFFIFVFAGLCAGAQAKFSASLSPLHAGRDEYITLKLTVANGSDIQQIIPPSLNDFSVVSGPNHETEMNSVNGTVKQYVSLSYVLIPKKTGTLSLGEATALVDGKTYKSAPVKVTVSGKRSSRRSQPNSLSSILHSGFDPYNEPRPDTQYDDYILRKGESVPEKVSRNMQLKLHTDKSSCYVGEPIVAAYKLYTRLRSESSLSKNPSFNGFSVVDMNQNEPPASSNEMLNGREYNVYTIRKAQLYPLQAGPVQLEAASLDNKIGFLKGSDRYATIVTENVTLSSKPVTVHVKPLPEDGKPADFTGAVGTFNIVAALEKNNFSTDETGKLIITITGRGNLQLMTAPTIKWPADFEVFDAALTDNTDKSTIPLTGSKTFEIPFAIQNPGNYKTPPINFSYFDPATASYKTVSAKGISFSVVKGAGTVLNNVIGKQKKNAATDETGMAPLNLYLLLAALVIAGFIYVLRRKKNKNTQQEIMSVQVPQEEIPAVMTAQHNPLTQTEECLQKENCTDFYAVLNGEMKHFLARRFAIPEAMMTCKGLSAAMDKAGVDNTVSLQTHELLQEIHLQLYTPFEQSEKLYEMYARAQTVIQRLDMEYA